jgi:hypothetical protein
VVYDARIGGNFCGIQSYELRCGAGRGLGNRTRLPEAFPIWFVGGGIGALAGSWLSLRHLNPSALRLVLSVLLLVAGVRMVAF